MHRCGREGDVASCRILLQYGIDSSIISLQGYTAIQLATEPVQRLLHGKYYNLFKIIRENLFV